ncbi:MAG: hypothetical protein QOH52_2576 [Pseudonocardiales bacterium]|jgi:hypothetical protein|nr:hypothetical protein [Pseudonocardiales bacterium]
MDLEAPGPAGQRRGHRVQIRLTRVPKMGQLPHAVAFSRF